MLELSGCCIRGGFVGAGCGVGDGSGCDNDDDFIYRSTISVIHNTTSDLSNRN